MNSNITEFGYVPAAIPNKFEAGTLNCVGILTLKTAVEYLNAFG
jgi:selenocysteine lyase/cysteine desulfurase